MRIAVLALQGAFIEHEQMLQRLGVETFEVRQLKDWQQPKDGLILPGGESTVQMRLLSQLGLYDPIREAILGGLPVFGTCAGMILLSKGYLGTMDILVRRNAYGRQLGSFHTVGTVEGIGKDLPMTFIRAPYIETVLSDVCFGCLQSHCQHRRAYRRCAPRESARYRIPSRIRLRPKNPPVLS